jgi:hypothetical protein
MNVGANLSSVFLCLNQDRFETALKKVTATPMLFVEIDRIRRIDRMYDSRQMPPWGFDEQMIVISHKAIDMNDRLELVACIP